MKWWHGWSCGRPACKCRSARGRGAPAVGHNAEMSTALASRGKILVVDDDRLVLATVTYGLAEAGYEVIDADNGDDAILLAREHRPALA